jgi:hypothetical protein
MDMLEEHIRKNRENLDKYNPPSVIRRRIKKELGIGKPMLRKWISLAAMIVVVLGTAIIFFKPQFRWTDKENDSTARTYPQLKETEIYYNNLVNSLYKEAAPLLINNPDVKKELNTDLSQIDSICIDIKKDLKDNISNQEVVEALIQNYRTKISILEDMLTVLKENENNPEKKKSHEL